MCAEPRPRLVGLVESEVHRRLGPEPAGKPQPRLFRRARTPRSMARLSVEEIVKDRAAFAREVAEEAETSLTNQGLVLDTFQLQDIQAEGTYLADLGRPEAARVLKEASIAEARARQAAQQEQLLADEAIAISQRQLALKQAEITAETDDGTDPAPPMHHRDPDVDHDPAEAAIRALVAVIRTSTPD